MEIQDAFALVIFEGTAADGMVVETRAGTDPGVARVSRLLDALVVLRAALAGATTLDRPLANALYGLSFHLSATLEQRLECDWIELYMQMLVEIEAIFEGRGPDE